jgi:hypothetical protein
MKILSHEAQERSRSYIMERCSSLTRQRFIHIFQRENTRAVLAALSEYQNSDGGFGHNLEGDFMLPASSPLATSVAFQILSDLMVSADEPLAQKGIAYLLSSYNPDRKGWVSVPREVNDYPHASWWHFTETEGGTVIDYNWGNPTAELVGYLVQYRSLVPDDFLLPLYKHTIEYLRSFSGAMEMHELYCFLRLAEQLSADDFQAVRPKLIDLVMSAATTDPEGWKSYSAQPLDFVKSPESFLYPALQAHVETNLDYWVDSLDPNGIVLPPWNWENYPDAWQTARVEITGRLTLERLIILGRFQRLAD